VSGRAVLERGEDDEDLAVRTAIVALLAIAACQDAPAPSAPHAHGGAPAPATAPAKPAPPAIEAGEGSIAEPIGCAQAFTRQAARRIYDDCDDASWSPSACEIPYGAQFCHASVWTVVCRRDADCPSSMRCISDDGVGDIDVAASGYGWCALRCANDASCGRSDLYCDRDDGLCRARVHDEQEEGPGDQDADAD
jgi:hypothetical protein